MSKWRKYMSLFAAGSMMVSSLACVASADEPVEITMMCDWTSDESDSAEDMAMIAEKLGYTLKFENVDSDTYKTKIRIMLQANELPDIFFTWGGSYSTPFLEAGALYPLEDTIAELGYDLLDSYEQPDENGHNYSAPGSAIDTYALFYNKDVFEQIGMEVPTNWDELLAVVEACNEQGIGAIGIGNKDRWEGDLFYNMMVLREDVDAFANAESGDGSFTDEPFLTAAEKVQTLVEMGAFYSGYMQSTCDECLELLKVGQIAMYPAGSWNVSYYADDENIGCTVFPQTGDEDPYLYCCSNAANSGLVVNAYSENAAEAAKLIIEFSKYRSEKAVAAGAQAWFATDTECEEEPAEIISTYYENSAKLEKTQLWWYDYLDTSIGEPMRDLSSKQFAGQIEAADFVTELEAIINGAE